MDDLTQKLDHLLSSPDGMKRIEDLMTALGGSASPTVPTAPPSDLPDVGMMLKLAPLMAQLGREDDSSALLHALRPHLMEERQKKLDDAAQMLKLIKLLPLLGELGGKNV